MTQVFVKYANIWDVTYFEGDLLKLLVNTAPFLSPLSILLHFPVCASSIDSLQMENENHFDTTLPFPLVFLGLILMPLGMVEQVLIISYEMFGMDPMKRGIVNRVRMKYV